MPAQAIRVSKLDAARRQLDGAIQLWFYDGDPVAIHALACAAHQIIQDINEKRGEKAFHLEAVVKSRVKPEQVDAAMNLIRKPMMFFKHANRDPHDILEFNPELSESLILFAIMGLQLLGERISDFQFVFSRWSVIHHPELYQYAVNNPPPDSIYIETPEKLIGITKKQFLELDVI